MLQKMIEQASEILGKPFLDLHLLWTYHMLPASQAVDLELPAKNVTEQTQNEAKTVSKWLILVEAYICR